MERSLVFPAVLFLALVSASCSLLSSIDENNIFPQSVGKFSRNGSVTSYGSGSYRADYTNSDARISYGYDLRSSGEEAKQKVKSAPACDTVNAVNKDRLKILKQEPLKNKSGQEIGSVIICREEVKDSSTDKVGVYNYKIILANDKNNLYLYGNETLSLADLTEFVQALPANAQADFTGLNLARLIAENSPTSVSADDLLKLNPPVKLAREPYIKGKVLIATQTFSGKATSDFNGAVLFEKDPEPYGLTKDTMADSLNGADTVVQIKCSKGAKLGDYVTKDAEQKRFPAYASDCKLSVIDNSIPAVIAQKTFVGKFLSDEEKFTEIDKEVRALPPITEMREFIKSLPKK